MLVHKHLAFDALVFLVNKPSLIFFTACMLIDTPHLTCPISLMMTHLLLFLLKYDLYWELASTCA